MVERELQVDMDEYIQSPDDGIAAISDFILEGKGLSLEGMFMTFLIEASIIEQAGTDEQKKGFITKTTGLYESLIREGGAPLKLSSGLSAFFLFLSTVSMNGNAENLEGKMLIVKANGEDVSYSLRSKQEASTA